MNDVPCGSMFPSCKFIKESHKNKALINDQRSLVDDLNENILGISQSVNALESESLHNKIERYNLMLKKESDDRLSLVRLENLHRNESQVKKDLQKDVSSIEKTLVELKLKSENFLSFY